MATEAQTIERLEQVVRVLRELPKGKKFDLGGWGRCGTVACAVGWAGLDPWFKKRGFVCIKNDEGWLMPETRYTQNWPAVEEFFGLSEGDALWLFSDDAYPRGSKSDVIRRIEAHIRKLRKAA